MRLSALYLIPFSGKGARAHKYAPHFLQLVDENYVQGWDDPRMPTISGLRRRGYTPEAIRKLVERAGVAKKDASTVDIALLQHTIREDLNKRAPRVMMDSKTNMKKS